MQIRKYRYSNNWHIQAISWLYIWIVVHQFVDMILAEHANIIKIHEKTLHKCSEIWFKYAKTYFEDRTS